MWRCIRSGCGAAMNLKLLLLLFLVTELRAVRLLVSQSTSVKVLDDVGKSPPSLSTVTPTTHLAIAVDYHLLRGEIYFSDGTGRILRGELNPGVHTKDPVVIAEVKLSDGLAVDWVNNYLYWTDITRMTVEMANLDGKHRRVLFDDKRGVEKPRAIVLDPAKGIMFWSDWGRSPRVESSGLDGKGRSTIVSSDLVWPNGLTLDLANQRLYVLDGLLSVISSYNYDGSDKTVVGRSTENMQQAFGLTIFGQQLYWTSWRTHTLFSMDVKSGMSSLTAVYKRTGVRSIVERMMGLKAVDPVLQRQSEGQSPCATAGCSHICLTGRGLVPTCSCPYGFELKGDEKTCVERGYLLLSWRRTIRRYSLEGGEEEPLLDSSSAAISVDYHYKKGLVFWSDIEEHRIYRAPIDQLNNKTVVVTTETCDGLAVDWVHDVLYWTDTDHNTLSAARLDGSNSKVIVFDHLDQPRDIALDPSAGLMFWTDWGIHPKIEGATLDGSDRKTIVSNEIAWPNGLTIDYDNKKLFWTDGKLSFISSCLYDGSQRKQIIGSQIVASQPFAISMLHDVIYWTDWKTQAIFRADLDSAFLVNRLANSSTPLLRPNGLKVVHSIRQTDQQNPCASLNCQELCVGSGTPNRGRCLGEVSGETSPQPPTPEEKPEEIELSTVALNDSVEISVSSSKVPSLVVVTTKCIRREACTDVSRCSVADEKTQLFENTKTLKVSDLLPATHYEVVVRLIFRAGSAGPSTKTSTIRTADPDAPVVKLNSPVVNGTDVTLSWDPVDTCVPGFKGYHYKIYEASKENELYEINTNLTSVTVHDLEPETRYIAQVYTYQPTQVSNTSFETGKDEVESQTCFVDDLICDGKEDCEDGADEAVGVCAAIEEVIVYEKGASEAHFRVRVSNTTNKLLDKFVIKYVLSGSGDMKTMENPPTPCLFWPESYCLDVTALGAAKDYSFSIYPVLKGGKAGSPVETIVYTKEGVSGPPEDLKVASYTPNSAVIQLRHPNQTNGILRNFIINIQELETFREGQCCQVFPILEAPAKKEGEFYTVELGGFSPAATYATSITVKTLYAGSSKEIDIYTPPPAMEMVRNPNIEVSSLAPLSWKPMEEEPDKEQQLYHALIKSYMLLLLAPRAEQNNYNLPLSSTNSVSELGDLQSILEDKIGSGFTVLWNKQVDDAAAFKQAIKVEDLTPRKQYELAWVQVAQYKEAFSVNYIVSDPFMVV